MLVSHKKFKYDITSQFPSDACCLKTVLILCRDILPSSCRAGPHRSNTRRRLSIFFILKGKSVYVHLGKKGSPFHSLSPLICSPPRTFFVRKCAPPFCSHYSYAKKAISRIIFGVGKKEEGDGGASVSFHFIPAVESEMTERFRFYSSFLCPPLPLSP